MTRSPLLTTAATLLCLFLVVRGAIVLRLCSRRSVVAAIAFVSERTLDLDISSGKANAIVSCHTVCYLPPSQDEHVSLPSTSNTRPFAPVEALLPATQQRKLLVAALRIVEQWNENYNDTTANKTLLITQLKSFINEPSSVSRQKTAVSMTRRYQNDEKIIKKASIDGVDVPKLSGTVLRAALNVYTANLRFGDSYILTASPKDKKELIRTYDGLPDVRTVITADLDLRDLYRNRVQTLVEEVQAELWRIDTNGPDIIELKNLLQDASNTMDKWFALISEREVKEALNLLVEKGNQTLPALPNAKFRGYNFWS